MPLTACIIADSTVAETIAGIWDEIDGQGTEADQKREKAIASCYEKVSRPF